MNDEARLQSVINMHVNFAVVLFGGMANSLASSTDSPDDGNGHKKGDEMHAEASQNISTMQQELAGVADTLYSNFAEIVGALSAEERAELMEDIKDDSYTAALDSIKNTDFGLPRITERLGIEELAKYISKIESPLFCQIMESVSSVNQPRAFMRSTEASPMLEEETPESPPAPPAPAVIEELPARFEFPPHFSSTITFPSDEEITLIWNSTFKGEPERYGIKVESTVDCCTRARANPSGSEDFKPEGGIITITMTNREDFPMTVDISAN